MAIQSPKSHCRDRKDHTDQKRNKYSRDTRETPVPTPFPALPDEAYRAQATEQIPGCVSYPSTRAHEFSRWSILQLAWAAVISVYTGSDDAIFALCIARSQEATPVIQPIQVPIHPEDTVDKAVASLETRNCTSSLGHDEVRPATSAGFPNILVLRQAKTTPKMPGNLSGYPLSLIGDIGPNALHLALNFDPEIISSRMGQLLMQQLVHVLNRAQRSPASSLKDLLGISPSDLEQVKSWGSRVHPQQKEVCVHEVILERCRESPSAPAVCAWDGSLDYSQLDKVSDHLSSRLVAFVPGSEQFVGLLLEKSMWTAVAILAVIKSGHAFFFLDPSLPDQRLQTLCRISQAPMILTSPEQAPRARQLGPKAFVVQDECQDPLQPLSNSLPAVNPHQAVYLAFTSGSSGEPKGVVVEHSAVCSGLDAYAASVDLDNQSRVFQFASYSFVISILDHLASLMRGACLCIASRPQIQDSLLDTMRAFEANWVEITPSVARVLDPDAIPILKTLCLTGESMTRSDLDRWHGKVNLKTCYGQSENSLGALVDTKATSSHPIDLGYPFAANCWIADSRDPDRLVPVGAEGELLLEGPSLARGYLRNEEQTRAAFIHDPAWLQQVRPGGSGRFLRTGDIVRYRPEDGSIQYIGRNGTQVKLRGQRIELAEVEFQLKEHYPASDAVVAEIVTPNPEESHDAALVAFISTTKHRQSDEDAGDNHLFARPSAEFTRESHQAWSRLHKILPAYMIPTHYVPLATLPLTSSGKLDRRRLRDQAAELGNGLQEFQPRVRKGHRQPTTENERVVQEICARILSYEPQEINLNDGFFEIGGNSITAIQLVSLAREAGFSFRAEQVFRQVPLAELAEQRGESKISDGDVTIESEIFSTAALKEKLMQQTPVTFDVSQVADVFPCTQPQQWLLDIHEGGCFMLRFCGPLDLTKLNDSCRRLVEAHTALRSLFLQIEGVLYNVVLNQIETPFDIHSAAPGEDPETAARDFCKVDGKHAFRLGILPLRFDLFQGSTGRNVLIMQLSHAQYDGSCQELLVSDLCALYQDHSSSVIPTDYGLYTRQVAARQTIAAFDFWKDLLAGSNLTALPYDIQPGENVLLACSTEVPLGSPPKGITMASVVKAAWSQVLHEVTGRDDIVLAQLVSTRGMDVPEVYRTIGLCLNRIPVRVQYQPGATASDILHAVQKQHVQCMAFEAAGWDNIVSRSTSWPARSRAQSLVIHQNFSVKKDFEAGDNLSCHLIDYVAIEPPPESLELYSEPEGDKLKLKLTAPSRLIGKAKLQMLLEKLRSTLEHFTTGIAGGFGP